MCIEDDHWNWREDINEEAIKSCLDQGMCVLQMQEHFGVCRETIERRLMMYDLKAGKGRKRGARRKRIAVEKIKELMAEGMTMAEMSKHLGVSSPILSREMKRQGISPKRGRPKKSTS